MVQSTLEEKVPSLLKATIETEPTPLDNLPDVEKGMPLVSSQTSEVVTNAFENLTHTILSNNTRTMENVVEDMLRPMLKAWLDQNLPVMVERLVRAEIERVSRGEQHYR
jgi:cell pole-organizing protein PopZ